MDLSEKIPLMIAHLEMVAETLQTVPSIPEGARQTGNPLIVDDYYSLMLALERAKEAEERLTAVSQKLRLNKSS
jgi:hypothetical protein